MEGQRNLVYTKLIAVVRSSVYRARWAWWGLGVTRYRLLGELPCTHGLLLDVFCDKYYNVRDDDGWSW